MINLNKDPRMVYGLIQDDLVILDGQEFIVETTDVVKGGIYLSKNTDARKRYLKCSNKMKDELVYSEFCVHVRGGPDLYAVFTPQELVEILKSKQYTIA